MKLMTFKDELRELRKAQKQKEEAQRKNEQKGLDLEEIIKIEYDRVCKRAEEVERKKKIYAGIVEHCKSEAKEGKMYAHFIVSYIKNDIFFLVDKKPVSITKEDLEYVARKNKFYLEYHPACISMWFEFGEHPFFKNNEKSPLKEELFEIWKKSQDQYSAKNLALRFFCMKYSAVDDSKEIQLNAFYPLPDNGEAYIEWKDVYAFSIMNDMCFDGKKIDFCLEDEVD